MELKLKAQTLERKLKASSEETRSRVPISTHLLVVCYVLYRPQNIILRSVYLAV